MLHKQAADGDIGYGGVLNTMLSPQLEWQGGPKSLDTVATSEFSKLRIRQGLIPTRARRGLDEGTQVNVLERE